MDRVFAAIDLKSFYASVECHERGLDPLTTNLVVADSARTDKTICLAVSPALKSYGLPGRARLFAVRQKVAEINRVRQQKVRHPFQGQSTNYIELERNPRLQLDFIIAKPRMQRYIDYSTQIYQIYLKYFAPDDIFAYSIDEVFCDLTSYLKLYQLSPSQLVSHIVNDVYQTTGITATAGIGSNLFLAKVAMDIMAKHAKPNRSGARIAALDEPSFRQQLWAHQPITDFWRVGHGYAKRLAKYHLLTMGDVARCSLTHPDLLYRLFGVNAELLIDHSWGHEPTDLVDIKNYHASTKSLSSGQVLAYPYDFHKTRIIIQEMAEALALQLVNHGLTTDQIVLHLSYDTSNLQRYQNYHGKVVLNHYHKRVPKPAHGSQHLPERTSSTETITQAFLALHQKIAQPNFTVRKVTLGLNHLIPPSSHSAKQFVQTELFANQTQPQLANRLTPAQVVREHQLQDAILRIRQRYGANSILRGLNFEDGSTAIARHSQIGGHHV